MILLEQSFTASMMAASTTTDLEEDATVLSSGITDIVFVLSNVICESVTQTGFP